MAIRGLTVGSDGGLRLDGAPFRNIGVNWGGAIVRIYGQPSPSVCEYTTATEQDVGLDYLASLGVKVIRVKACPFWPAQWTAGVLNGKAWNVATAGDREAHYAKIDAFVAKAAARGIGVVLNLFFRHATVADLTGSTVRGWLSAGNVRTFAQTLTTELVTRYATEGAVYGWEWSNEVNHYNDYTGSGYPSVSVPYGTPASYSAANDGFRSTESTSELASTLAWWYGVVRSIDSQRIVMSGNGPCSYTRPGGGAGTSAPIIDLHREVERDNPLNTSSIHFYGGIGYCSRNFRGFDALLTGAKHWARRAGKPFILGEFGNQPRKVAAVSAGVITLDASSDGVNNEIGDVVELVNAGAWSGRHTVQSIAADRRSLTVANSGAAAFSGVARMVDMTEDRITRMLDAVRASGTDAAFYWQYDSDPSGPVAESIDDLPWQAEAIRAANAALAS